MCGVDSDGYGAGAGAEVGNDTQSDKVHRPPSNPASIWSRKQDSDITNTSLPSQTLDNLLRHNWIRNIKGHYT